MNVSSIKPLVGKSGVIHLSNFEVNSFDTTDNLLFVGYTENGKEISDDICKRILELPVKNFYPFTLNSSEEDELSEKRKEKKEDLLSKIREKDSEYFQIEVDKLHKWAEDKILASEKELKDVKSKIKEINRDSKKTSSAEELLKIQTQLRDFERKKKRLRQEIFEVEDEIEEKRDNMISAIKAKMLKAINEYSIFTIKWKLL